MSFLDTLFGGPGIELQVKFSQMAVDNAIRSYEYGHISKETALAKVNKERKSVGSDPLTDLYANEELRARIMKKRAEHGMPVME